MSGEAGWGIDRPTYSLFLGSGRIVSVAIPPGGDDAYVGEYFARANEPYRRWLARAEAPLDALFAQLVVDGFPLGNGLGESDRCHLHARDMPNGRTLRFRVCVTTPLSSEQQRQIVERVVAIFRETEAESDDADATSNCKPPTPTPTLLARLRAWWRGGFRA